MDIITVDIETYYDQDFSLSKLSTEEYIRSPDFEVIGVGIKENGQDTLWFSGDYTETKAFLKKFNWAGSIVLAHNTLFDGAILSWHYGIHPKALADTLSMARAVHGIEVGGSLARLAEHYQIGVKGTEIIHAKGKRRLDFTPEELERYGSYCCNDVDLTYDLFQLISGQFSTNELKLIDLTLRMFTEPVLELDEDLLREHLRETQERKGKLLAATGLEKKDLMSTLEFATVLRNMGIDPPMKISPRTGQWTYAFSKTDKAFTSLPEQIPGDAPHKALLEALIAARLGHKSTLEETRTQRFIDIATRGRLPIPLKYYAAHTGRWGGTDKVNLQNLPARGKAAGKLKKAIRAPKGHVIIDCDSSQIEARTLAWLAGQDDLVEIFRRNNEEIRQGVPKDKHQFDPYKIMASTIYGKGIEEISDAERFVGKTTILGCGYGMGATKFKWTLGISGRELELSECEHIIRTYRATYPRIVDLWKQGNRCLGALLDYNSAPFGRDGVVTLNPIRGGFQTPNGIVLGYPDLCRQFSAEKGQQFAYRSRSGMTKIYGGKVTENIVQHLARCVIGEQMLRIAKRYRVVLTVHDAVACIARKEEAEEARAYVESCMQWVPTWADGLPLACESGMGETYGDC